MSYQRQLSGASDDAIQAMTEHPKYWLAWYTAKSLALVAAVGYIGFLLGKRSR